MMNQVARAMLVALAITATACQVPFQYAARRFYREAKGIKYDAFEAKPLLRDLSTYDRLIIEPLDNQMEDEIPAHLVTELEEQLVKQVSQVKGMEVIPAASSEGIGSELAANQGPRKTSAVPPGEGAWLSSLPVSPAAPARGIRRASRPQMGAHPASRTLILRTAIVDYHPGYRAMRVLQIGVGREAVLTLHLWFVDGATRQELGQFVIDSEVYRMPSDGRAAVNKMASGVGALVAKLVEKRHRPSARRKVGNATRAGARRRRH